MSGSRTLSRVVRRRVLWLAGLGAALGLSPASIVRAGQSFTLKLGESSEPLMPGAPTEVTSSASPTLRVAATQVGWGLEAKGGTGHVGPLWEKHSGGTALVAEGGSAGGRDGLTGGTAVVARGGKSDASFGGLGVFFRGGNVTKGLAGYGLDVEGNQGLVAEGGRCKQAGERGLWGGEGIRAYAGTGAVVDLDKSFGAGIVAWGGEPPYFTTWKGVRGPGAVATGWITEKGQPRAPGAHGIAEARGHGVYGQTLSNQAPAVLGWSGSTATGARGEVMVGTGIGIFGRNNGVGPGGSFRAKSGKGVQAFGAKFGIRAEAPTGWGIASSTTGSRAIVGRSTNGDGVVALSQKGVGSYFETTNAAAVAVTASHAQATPAGGPRGLFVNGDCIVENGVKPEGFLTSLGMSMLYIVEAALSVFEDFGTARLQGGRARVELDRLFAETIETDGYQVLLTARGDSRGVFVAARDATGFEIREQAGGTSSVEVTYRIVARRKGFRPEQRLARFATPPAPARPTVPDVPPHALRRPVSRRKP